jgi:hypothetical protein
MKISCIRQGSVGIRVAMVVLGAVTVLTTDANGEQGQGDLHFACAAAGQVDPARAAEICAEFLAVLKDSSGFTPRSTDDVPLTKGPGLEILVTKASDSMLELEPTWTDSAGSRMTRTASGIRTMDTNLTDTLRRSLYLRLLANSP